MGTISARNVYEISETFNDWMQRYGQKKYPKNGGFPPFATPQDFFQKSGSVIFVPLWHTNFMQKLEKSLERSPRYLKTDQRTDWPTDKGDYNMYLICDFNA